MIGKNRIPMYRQESRGENGMPKTLLQCRPDCSSVLIICSGSSFLSGADGHPKKSLQIYESMGAILMQTTTVAKTI